MKVVITKDLNGYHAQFRPHIELKAFGRTRKKAIEHLGRLLIDTIESGLTLKRKQIC